MDAIDTLIAHMRILYNSTVLGFYPEKDVRKLYPELSDAEYGEKYGGNILCQGMAMELRKWLTANGYESKYLFFYNKPLIIKQEGFNIKYLDIIINRDMAGFKSLVDAHIDMPGKYNSLIRTTHGVVQVILDDKAYVVDPYCCLFYACSKEDLLQYPDNVYEQGYYFREQGTWLRANSIHINRSHRIFASPLFWQSVYRLSDTDSGDLPPLLDGEAE